MVSVRRGLIGLIAGVMLVPALPARAAEVEVLLPSDADLVLSINVRQILDSSLSRKYGLGPVRAMFMDDDEVKSVFQSLGLNPFKDINSFHFAGQGSPEKTLFILHGRFDRARFHAKAEAVARDMAEFLKIHKEGRYIVYETTPPVFPQPMFVALLDQATLVASPNRDYVLEALDKAAGKRKPSVKKELRDLVEKVDSKQSLWFVALARALEKSPVAGAQNARDIIGKLGTVTASLMVADDVNAELIFTARDAASARDLTKQLKDDLDDVKRLIRIYTGDKKEIAPVLDVLDGFKVSMAGSAVILNGRIPGELIQKSLPK